MPDEAPLTRAFLGYCAQWVDDKGGEGRGEERASCAKCRTLVSFVLLDDLRA